MKRLFIILLLCMPGYLHAKAVVTSIYPVKDTLTPVGAMEKKPDAVRTRARENITGAVILIIGGAASIGVGFLFWEGKVDKGDVDYEDKKEYNRIATSAFILGGLALLAGLWMFGAWLFKPKKEKKEGRVSLAIPSSSRFVFKHTTTMGLKVRLGRR